jgi:membrane peptidoglycan carboxypeptidase
MMATSDTEPSAEPGPDTPAEPPDDNDRHEANQRPNSNEAVEPTEPIEAIDALETNEEPDPDAEPTPRQTAAARLRAVLKEATAGQKVLSWTDHATGEQRLVPRVDLTEAYAAVRRRGDHLRRRRVISSMVAGVIMASLLTIVGVYYVSSIPLPDGFDLPATTTVYYADGTTVMARLGSQRRVIVDVDQVPVYVSDAVLAAVEPTFFSDTVGVISRQYARAATGLDDSGPAGKARLLVMSLKLEDSYTKNQILEFYLNTVYFGRGGYGIEAAAQAYFGKHAKDLTLSEAVMLGGIVTSPGDGRYDPTVDLDSATQRFAGVAKEMVNQKTLSDDAATRLPLPKVLPYDPAAFESDLDRPTGLVVSQVLAELRATDAFRGKPTGYIENGGYRIVTTVDARVQAQLQRAADGTVDGSVMKDQPDNLQSAAVVVEPGTGRVLGYYGGHDGTGADYAGVYQRADGSLGGFGAHPPGQTFAVYQLAAALDHDISVQSVWNAPESKELPDLGRDLLDVPGAPCQPRCSLVQAASGGLTVPFYSLTKKVGPAAVIDQARAAGIDAMWTPATATETAHRYDLRGSRTLSPVPFGDGVGIGEYPVTVSDQANAMATLAAGGARSRMHFVRTVTKNQTTTSPTTTVVGEQLSSQSAIAAATVADLTYALTQSPAGKLPDGRPSASQAGSARLRTSSVEVAHAWLVGFTGNLAMAVWVGNVDAELPLKDKTGARVTGDTLPAQIYRDVMTAASTELNLDRVAFPTAPLRGDPGAGDATATTAGAPPGSPP